SVLTIVRQPGAKNSNRNCSTDRMKARLDKRDRKLEVRAHLRDLTRHGLKFVPDWDLRVAELDDLLFNPQKPNWMTKQVDTRIGHVHGDLNSRNTLVSTSNPKD